MRGHVADVHAYYLDLTHQQELHPLIQVVRLVAESGQGTPEHRAVYEIEETVPLLGLGIPNTYRVETSKVAPGTLTLDAYSKPGVHLECVLNFTQVEPWVVRVREDVTVAAPWLLRGFVERTAHDAHQKMLQRLKEVLAAR